MIFPHFPTCFVGNGGIISTQLVAEHAALLRVNTPCEWVNSGYIIKWECSYPPRGHKWAQLGQQK